MQWINADEYPPPFNQHVLCYDEASIKIAYRPYSEEYNEHWVICEDCCCCMGCTGSVRFWMPLPTAPKDE